MSGYVEEYQKADLAGKLEILQTVYIDSTPEEREMISRVWRRLKEAHPNEYLELYL